MLWETFWERFKKDSFPKEGDRRFAKFEYNLLLTFMDNSITSDTCENIRRKFQESRGPIEAILKQFKYRE